MKNKKIYSGWDSLPFGHVNGKVTPGCIVLEGGAFRGLYNQGVLDALLMHDIHIHTVIGVSAGALSGSAYVAGSLGRAVRINLKYRHDSNYVGLKAMKHCGSPFNIRFIIEENEDMEAFNPEVIKHIDRHYVAVATNCLTGETEYFDKYNCEDIFAAIKASASMPYVSPMVKVDNAYCLDGGCSCDIPYQWALDKQFEKIIIVKSRERGFRKEDKVSKLPSLVYKRYPNLARALQSKNIRYNKECDEIDMLEKEKRVFVVAPSSKVTVTRLEKDVEKLGALYWLGFNDTLHKIEDIKAYLEI